MKYWSYFAAKVLVASAVVYWLQHSVQFAFPVPPHTRYGPPPPMFLNDMAFTFSILLVWLVATGIFYLAVWDQRRRCRDVSSPSAHANCDRFLVKHPDLWPSQDAMDLPVWPWHAESG